MHLMCVLLFSCCLCFSAFVSLSKNPAFSQFACRVASVLSFLPPTMSQDSFLLGTPCLSFWQFRVSKELPSNTTFQTSPLFPIRYLQGQNSAFTHSDWEQEGFHDGRLGLQRHPSAPGRPSPLFHPCLPSLSLLWVSSLHCLFELTTDL